MSGAEVAVVLEIISASIELYHFVTEVCETVKNESAVPKKLEGVPDDLRLVLSVLKQVQHRINKGEVDAEACENAKPVLRRCKSSAEDLHDLLAKTSQASRDSQLSKFLKASKLQRKSDDIVEKMGEIKGHLELLSTLQIYQSAQISSSIIEHLESRSKSDAGQIWHHALFLTDPRVDRDVLLKEKDRVPGTCEWIKRHDLYNDWLHGRDPLLWVCGGPGKGKTMLSLFLTEDLPTRFQNSKDTRLVWYFCRAGDTRRNDAACVLRGLLWQILSQQPALSRHIEQYFDSEEASKAAVKSSQTLWTMLEAVAEDPAFIQTYCVLDGLDECTDNAWLARKIRNSTKQSKSPTQTATRLRYLVVSRDIPMFRKTPQTISLDANNGQQIESDIRMTVAARIEELCDNIDIDQDFRLELEDVLITRSEGTFLWVGLAVEELRQKTTCVEVEAALESMPAGLPAYYRRMLSSIQPEHRAQSIRIFRCVCLARRPLTIGELGTAAGLQPTARRTIEQVCREWVIELSGRLLILSAKEPEHEETVKFVHESARQLLLEGLPEDDGGSLREFAIQSEKGHAEMVSVCLEHLHPIDLEKAASILEFLKSGKHWTLRDHFEQLAGPRLRHLNHLLTYAIVHWPSHAREAHGHLAESLGEHGAFFSSEESLLRLWCSCYSFVVGKFNARRSTLDIACHLGILEWVKLLHQKQGTISIFNDHGRGPIWQAAIHDHSHVVEYLLHNAVDTDQLVVQKPQLLRLAAKTNNSALEEILREKLDQPGRADSHHRMSSATKSMMELLLEEGQDIEAQDQKGRRPLHDAAYNGSLERVSALLAAGAQVNPACNSHQQTALHKAAKRRYGSIVDKLLDAKADVHPIDIRGQTALHKGTREGIVAIVDSLIRAGSPLEVKDNNGFTALHIATYWNYIDAVDRLIQAGSDVHAENLEGRTALHLAALRGNVRNLKSLVAAGGNVTAQDSNGEQPVDLARQQLASWQKPVPSERMLDREAMIASYDSIIQYLHFVG